MTRLTQIATLTALVLAAMVGGAVLFQFTNSSTIHGGVLGVGPVTGVTITLGDTKAGATSQYTVAYTTSVSGALAAGGGR